MKHLASLYLLILWSFGAAAAQDSFLIYSAVKSSAAPVIDGCLDDACWQHAERTPAFVAIGGAAVPVQTVGMVVYDNASLYLAIVCPEPSMSKLKGFIDTNSVKDIDESVEVFIDSQYSQCSFLQFRVSVLGAKDTHDILNIRNDLTPQWSGAAAVNEDTWTVEMAIPFALLGGAVDESCLWGLNLNRQRLMGQGDMFTCWSDTKGPFASPSRFGHLVFSPYAAWLKAHYAKQVETLQEQISILVKVYPYVELLARSQTTALEALNTDFLASVGKTDNVTAAQCSSLVTLGEKLVLEYRQAVDNLRLKVIQSEFARK